MQMVTIRQTEAHLAVCDWEWSLHRPAPTKSCLSLHMRLGVQQGQGNDTQDFCVLGAISPQDHLLSRGGDFLLARTTRTTLGLAGAIGTGTSVLVLQDQNYRALRVAIDVDIATLEKNLSPT